ncbi:MAG: response regulator transcription factor [Anaerolineaceae bacterium]|nr:response regulator transcription factor [Anaerolineaceae bacterium]
MAATILVVDDDDLLRRSLVFSLEQAGFHVNSAATAEDAMNMTAQNRPELVLLDIMLPGMDGMAALRQFRDNLGIPVIFLTARRRELDQVLGLELGADDYITKPFNTDVVVARIHSVLRRIATPATAQPQDSPVQVGDLTIDPSARTVCVGEKSISLTPREFDLLFALALEPNKVLSVEALVARVWGAEYAGESQIVYVHIRWLREKIESDPQNPVHIVTVRGVGYKLVPQDADQS